MFSVSQSKQCRNSKLSRENTGGCHTRAKGAVTGEGSRRKGQLIRLAERAFTRRRDHIKYFKFPRREAWFRGLLYKWRLGSWSLVPSLASSEALGKFPTSLLPFNDKTETTNVSRCTGSPSEVTPATLK